MIEIIIFFFITLLVSIVSKKLNLIPNFTGENHQHFLKEKNIPLIGGIIFSFLSIYFFYEKNLIFCYSIFFYFFNWFFFRQQSH